MYKQHFRNQAVIEVKNGSTVAAVARKFSISNSSLKQWVDEYNNKMQAMIRNEAVQEEVKPAKPEEPAGIRLKSIKVVIDKNDITLVRNDVLKMLRLFDEFEEE